MRHAFGGGSFNTLTVDGRTARARRMRRIGGSLYALYKSHLFDCSPT